MYKIIEDHYATVGASYDTPDFAEPSLIFNQGEPIPKSLGEFRDIETGKIEPRFSNFKQLSVKGKAEVYRGHDNKFDIPIFVKALRWGEKATQDQLAQLAEQARKEAITPGKYHQMHSIFVNDFFEDKNEQVTYIVSEYLDPKVCPTMEDVIDENGGGVPMEVVIEVFEQLVQIVHSYDDSGLLHLDLKPANIFLQFSTPDQRDKLQDPFVKIADFGIANTVMSRDFSNKVWGTPPYMSLTRLAGRDMPEGIFNPEIALLGEYHAIICMIFELLVGRHPLAEAANPQQIVQLLQKKGVEVFTFTREEKKRLKSQKYNGKNLDPDLIETTIQKVAGQIVLYDKNKPYPKNAMEEIAGALRGEKWSETKSEKQGGLGNKLKRLFFG
jgi:serine/threonine protein kinase